MVHAVPARLEVLRTRMLGAAPRRMAHDEVEFLLQAGEGSMTDFKEVRMVKSNLLACLLPQGGLDVVMALLSLCL